MGWLIRYVGPTGDVIVPGESEPRTIEQGAVIDVKPSRDVRAVINDQLTLWVRVSGDDPDYVPAADR